MGILSLAIMQRAPLQILWLVLLSLKKVHACLHCQSFPSFLQCFGVSKKNHNPLKLFFLVVFSSFEAKTWLSAGQYDTFLWKGKADRNFQEKGDPLKIYIGVVNYPVHFLINLDKLFILFCYFSDLWGEIDISCEDVTYFHRVWFQNWICDIVERYNDSSDLL